MNFEKPVVVMRRWSLHGGRMCGDVYGHPFFTNGSFVWASDIQDIVKDSDDTFIVETFNTRYILEPVPGPEDRNRFDTFEKEKTE